VYHFLDISPLKFGSSLVLILCVHHIYH